MAKIALISDTHWGARGDSLVFADYFGRFYDEIFFPTLEREGIDHIVHLGDIVDRRKYINFMSLHKMKKHFFAPIMERGMKLDVIVGNHDVAYKNTNEINAMEELFSYAAYDKFNYYWQPKDVDIDGRSIAFLPWICSGNFEESMDFINTSSSEVLFGHLELKGFEMYRGAINDHGFDMSLFDRYKLVCSGHFHHKSQMGNVTYLGSPYEITWSDYNDPRGFHIFDTETLELTYIQNPLRMFFKLRYCDKTMTREDIIGQIQTKGVIENSYIKVVVSSKTNMALFDSFISAIEQEKVSDIQVVEDHMHMGSIDDDTILDEAEDTMTLLTKYVDNIATEDIDKQQLIPFLHALYDEAISLD